MYRNEYTVLFDILHHKVVQTQLRRYFWSHLAAIISVCVAILFTLYVWSFTLLYILNEGRSVGFTWISLLLYTIFININAFSIHCIYILTCLDRKPSAIVTAIRRADKLYRSDTFLQ